MDRCKVVGCKKNVRSIGFCSKHYTQIRRHGKIFERTIYDSNEFVQDGKMVRIFLFDKNGNKNGEALIDKSDLKIVKKYKWYLIRRKNMKHCATRSFGKTEYLHRILMPGKEIDHQNRNGLDNRRFNLRDISHQKNCFNSSPGVNNKMGLKGVSEYRGKRLAQIMKDGKNHYLGCFKKVEDAIEAYDKAAKKYFGKFAYLNSEVAT